MVGLPLELHFGNCAETCSEKLKAACKGDPQKVVKPTTFCGSPLHSAFNPFFSALWIKKAPQFSHQITLVIELWDLSAVSKKNYFLVLLSHCCKFEISFWRFASFFWFTGRRPCTPCGCAFLMISNPHFKYDNQSFNYSTSELGEKSRGFAGIFQ